MLTIGLAEMASPSGMSSLWCSCATALVERYSNAAMAVVSRDMLGFSAFEDRSRQQRPRVVNMDQYFPRNAAGSIHMASQRSRRLPRIA